MDNPTGTIFSLVTGEQGARALVDVDAGLVCPRCAAGKGCGAGLLGANAGPRRVAAVVAEHRALATGDRVELVLASSSVLHAALIVYGLPLLGAVAAAVVAYVLALGDGGATLAVSAGLLAGWSVSRWQLRRRRCLQQFMPLVGRRLHTQASGR
jgi:sigma-E factor negative regulatory protein RseC